MRRLLPLATTALLVLAACTNGDDEPTDSVALDAQDGSAEDQGPDNGTDGETDSGADDGNDVAGAGEQDPTDAGDDQTPDPQGDANGDGADQLASIDVAQPGTWPVGDAGTVAFDVVDRALVLENITESDGWSSSIDDEEPDEIDVRFSQGSASWRFEVEFEDDASMLEIELDFEDEDASAGSYDIGDAGTFAFEVDGDQLTLSNVLLDEGWTLTDEDEDEDEFEFEVEQGERRVEVEVELDDGSIEVHIDYTVISPVQ